MASKFNVWIDDGQVTGSNTLSLTDDSQKKVGFKAGTAASSQRVNTILRETSLVSTALMNIFDSNGTCTYASPLSAVQALMSSYFNGFVPSTRKVAGKSLAADVSLGKLTVKLNDVQQGDAYDGTVDKEINLTEVMLLSTGQTVTGFKTFTKKVKFSAGMTSNESLQIVDTSNNETRYSIDRISKISSTTSTSYMLPTVEGTLLVDKNIKLYRHNIQLQFDKNSFLTQVAFSILSFSNNIPLTNITDATAFINSTISNKYIVCSGCVLSTTDNETHIASAIFYSSVNNEWFIRYDVFTTISYPASTAKFIGDDVETISLSLT